MKILSALLQKIIPAGKANAYKTRQLKEGQRRLKEDCQLLQSKHQALFDNTDNGCIILEPRDKGHKFIIKDFNRGAEKIENINKNQVIGIPFREVFPKASDAGLKEAFQRVYTTGNSELIPVTLKENEQIIHFHQNTIVKVPDQQLMVIYSESKELEISRQALEKSKKRLNLALESTQIGLWDHNLKTGKVYRSKEWAEMLGYTKEEIDNCADAWKQLIHPDDLPKVEQMAEAHETRQSNTFQVEHRLKTKKGTYKWILNWGKIVEYDNNGKPVRAIGTHLDIDQRKKTEDQLAELNATKDRLFSIIGHDLKNPLSDILGLSSLIIKNYDKYSSEKLFKLINLINYSATNMQTLLEDLLKWARLQREEASLKPEILEITELLEDTVAQFQTKADAKSITLTNTVKEACQVYADKNMIETVLRNLISNAVKYTGEGGAVSVYTQETREKLTVCIEDTGMGMNEDTIKSLFNPNKGTTEPESHKEKGSGFGLILCKDILDQHGENIRVQSEPGKGSIFKFTLKKAQSSYSNSENASEG